MPTSSVCTAGKSSCESYSFRIPCCEMVGCKRRLLYMLPSATQTASQLELPPKGSRDAASIHSSCENNRTGIPTKELIHIQLAMHAKGQNCDMRAVVKFSSNSGQLSLEGDFFKRTQGCMPAAVAMPKGVVIRTPRGVKTMDECLGSSLHIMLSSAVFRLLEAFSNQLESPRGNSSECHDVTIICC